MVAPDTKPSTATIASATQAGELEVYRMSDDAAAEEEECRRAAAESLDRETRTPKEWARVATEATEAIAMATRHHARRCAGLEGVKVALDVMLGNDVARHRLDALAELGELARGTEADPVDRWERSVRLIAAEVQRRVDIAAMTMQTASANMDQQERDTMARLEAGTLCRAIHNRLGSDWQHLTESHCGSVLRRYSSKSGKGRVTITGIVADLLIAANPWPEPRDRDQLLKAIDKARKKQ